MNPPAGRPPPRHDVSFCFQHESSRSLKSSPSESSETLKQELPAPNLVTGSLGGLTEEELSVAISSHFQAEKNKQTATTVRGWIEGNDGVQPSAKMVNAFNSWVANGDALGWAAISHSTDGWCIQLCLTVH